MSVFTKTATAEGTSPDPAKHVRYVDGMVLGVDDFTQEFAYVSNRHSWICRDLFGYGTVSGLAVSIGGEANAPRVVVEPGTAVSPRGEMVRVDRAQCASLGDWLGADRQQKVLAKRGEGGGLTRTDVYVTLRYSACETDARPIPGEPCRTEDDMLVPSRYKDDFVLELGFEPPPAPDEAAVRDFVSWLAQVPIVDGASSLKPQEFADAIRAAAHLVGSPPSPPDFMYGSPPGDLRIGRADTCRFLRTAYRLWVTELRPRWYASWWGTEPPCSDTDPAADSDRRDALLLARLDLPLLRDDRPGVSLWRIPDLDIAAAEQYVDQEPRPFLVSVRMLQEWLWCGWGRGPSTVTPPVGPLRPGAITPRPAAGDGAEVVAVGSVTVGAPPAGTSKLAASADSSVKGGVLVTFASYRPPAGFEYAVLTQTIAQETLPKARIDVVSPTDKGIVLCVSDGARAATAEALKGFRFVVQVSRCPV